jgi:hypothetical protein
LCPECDSYRLRAIARLPDDEQAEAYKSYQLINYGRELSAEELWERAQNSLKGITEAFAKDLGCSTEELKRRTDRRIAEKNKKANR